MAKKADLLEQAKELGLKVTEKNTIAELEALINDTTVAETVKPTEEPKVAKAGKRSEKGIKETEEKEAKIEAQKHREDTEKAEVDKKPKQASKPTRARLERRSKGYRKANELVDRNKQYSLNEAVDLALKTNPAKFDATVEIHVRLGVDPKQADQNIRDNIVLPAGTGKTVRVAVFADEDLAKEAKKAGADVAGGDEFLTQLDKGVIDFDVLIATPNVMAKLSKYARILGPKGLMPNPKSGTVTMDVAKAVSQSKAGKVEYRVDSNGIVHLGVGKVSFGNDKIAQNLNAVFASIKSNKPASTKGAYVRTVTLTTSMGPGIKIASSEIA